MKKVAPKKWHSKNFVYAKQETITAFLNKHGLKPEEVKIVYSYSPESHWQPITFVSIVFYFSDRELD
ncbi:MAG: hypothetical protein HYT61_01760 [Candidatus Yanofskybacteria bacterium]|nr:hypothetical protein [Candidatus Yanofskybacteria bacterium]